LGDVEAQAVELRRCLKVMGQENLRLRQASAAESDSRGTHGNPDAEMLRDLVGSQQRTISKLQSLLHTLTPDTDKAQELADAINKIQRSNNELNSCVMVLEDENNMLRGEVETLQERLAGLEKPAVADGAKPVKPISDSAPAQPDASGLEAASIGTPKPALNAGDSDTDSLLADLFGGTNNERSGTEK
jgi:septal ring factor EnvC (AmiA/AmiB activator)